MTQIEIKIKRLQIAAISFMYYYVLILVRGLYTFFPYTYNFPAHMVKTNKTRNNSEKIRPFAANIDELPQYLCRTHFIYMALSKIVL